MLCNIYTIYHTCKVEGERGVGWERGVGDRQVSAKGKGEVRNSKVNSM